MPDKYKNKYRIQTNRLQGFDYGSHAYYFITICTKNRKHYFGEITVEPHNCAALQATEMGKIAHNFWQEIPHHYPFVVLDEFVVMPNHIHGILFFNRPDKSDWTPNAFGVQSKNLGAVIRAFKSSVKRYANQNEIEFQWQSRFYDHIIRNEKEYFTIKNYIINNPQNWKEDMFNKNKIP